MLDAAKLGPWARARARWARHSVAVLELGLLVAICLLAVGPETLWQGLAPGHDTRDLWDHLALLDQWSIHIQEWSAPDGGVLVPPDLFGMVLAAPWLALGVERATAYGLATWAQLSLGCAGGWMLGRRSGGGLASGAVFGLSPYLVGQALTGESETLSAWPLAFCLYFLVEGKPIRGGAFAALAALGAWYHGAYAALMLVAWLLWKRERQALVPLLVFGGLIALPALGYWWVLQSPDQLFRGPDMGDYLAQNRASLAWMSTDPTQWFGRGPVADHHHVHRVSWVAVLAAGLGLWRSRRWGFLALTFGGAVLSLGPILHWAGEPVFEWMPYRWLLALPLFELMRLPHRWLVVAMLGLAALAGESRWPKRLGVLIALESVWLLVPGAPGVSVQSPPITQSITGAVLELPLRTFGHDARGRYLVWQRVHRQATPASLLMQGWSSNIAREPLVVAVSALDSLDAIAARPVQAAQIRQGGFAQSVAQARALGLPPVDGAGARLRALGIEQVVLHGQLVDGQDLRPISRLLEAALGEPTLHQGEGTLWEL